MAPFFPWKKGKARPVHPTAAWSSHSPSHLKAGTLYNTASPTMSVTHPPNSPSMTRSQTQYDKMQTLSPKSKHHSLLSGSTTATANCHQSAITPGTKPRCPCCALQRQQPTCLLTWCTRLPSPKLFRWLMWLWVTAISKKSPWRKTWTAFKNLQFSYLN